MRATMIKLMSVVLIFAAAPFAQAQTPSQYHASQVESWYERYLGRTADPAGLNTNVQALCQGTLPIYIEANLLASTEYFDRNGGSDASFVAALYRDVLGIVAGPQQIQQAAYDVQRLGNRQAYTVGFLQTQRGVAPAAPVVQTYRPAYVAPTPVVVQRPVYVAPIYRPAPVYRPGYVRPVPYAAPGFSVGIREPGFSFGVNVR